MNIDKKYFRNKLLALRNALDETLEELGPVDQMPTPSRQRRNLKDERVIQMEASMASGTWRKPKKLNNAK